MQDLSSVDAAYEAICITRKLMCLLSDAHYTLYRGNPADVVLHYLNEAEKECCRVLSRIDKVREEMTAVVAIDRMASVSCGD